MNDDPCAPLEQSADRIDHLITHARDRDRSEEETLRLRSLQMSVRDAIRNYRGEKAAGAFQSAFTKNFLSVG